jgi:Rrf2 family protein
MTLAATMPLSIVSRKDLLAIVIVVDVAIHGRDEPVRAMDLAARHNSGLRYFEPMLQLLAASDIMQGKRGKKGGYQLARDPRDISVADVIRVVHSAEQEDIGRATQKQSSIERVVSQAVDAAVDDLSKSTLNITIQDLVESAEGLDVPRGTGRRGP